MADFSLGTAELGTSVDLSGLNKGLGDAESATKEKTGGLGSLFGNIFAGAAGGLVASGLATMGGAVTDFFGSAIGDAREAAVLMGQTQAVITSTGGAAGVTAQQVADMAGSLSAAAGKSLFGDDQIQAGENLLLTFTNIKETLPDATSIMVDMAQAMGTDVKGGAIQLGKALNDPIAGISALSRVGVTFTDEQKAQIKTMQDAGNMAGAQKVILAELNKEFGGSAEAAAKADGGMAQFKDQLGEMGETLGTALLPILNQLVGFLTTTIMPVVQQAAAAFTAWLANPETQAGIQAITNAITTGLGVAFQFLGTTLIPMLITAFNLLSPVIAFIAGLLINNLAPTVQSTGGTFQGVQVVISGVMDAIQAVVGAVLGQLVVFWQSHGAEIMATAQSTWAQIQQIIALLVELIKATIIPAFQAIAGFISAHGAEIQAVLGAVWTIIKSLIDAALAIITGVIRVALAVIHGDWEGAWNAIKEMVDRVWGDIKQIFEAAITIVKNELSMAWDSIKGTVNSAFEGIKSTISGAWESIKSGASSAWEGIKGTISDAIGGLVDLIRGLPDRVAAVGAAIVQAIWDGIRARWQQLVDWFSDRLQELRDQLPFSEPKDRSSPLYGLSRAGEALTEAIQAGIFRHGPLEAPPLAPSSALASAGTNIGVNFTMRDGRSGLLQELIRVEVQQQLRGIGKNADSRSRTR